MYFPAILIFLTLKLTIINYAHLIVAKTKEKLKKKKAATRKDEYVK